MREGICALTIKYH